MKKSQRRIRSRRSKKTRRARTRRSIRMFQKGGMTPYATVQEELTAINEWVQAVINSQASGVLLTSNQAEDLLKIILRLSISLTNEEIRQSMMEKISDIQSYNFQSLNPLLIDQAIKHINSYEPAAPVPAPPAPVPAAHPPPESSWRQRR